MIGQDLLRCRDYKAIICDGESENLSLIDGRNRPWELAWLIVENGKITKRFQKFPFIHDLNVGEGAAQVTRFNFNQWKAKTEDARGVYDLFASYLYNPEYIIIGQNILNFDVYLIKNLQDYLGVPIDYSYVSRIYDTKCIGFAHKTGVKFPTKKNDVPCWMYRFAHARQKGIKVNLAQLCKDYNVPYNADRHHEGLYDVELTYSVFKQQCFSMDVI